MLPLFRRKLCELQDFLYIECDDPKRLLYDIEYGLPGWYSLDDDGVFRKSEHPTYCRIRIHGPGRFQTTGSLLKVCTEKRNVL